MAIFSEYRNKHKQSTTVLKIKINIYTWLSGFFALAAFMGALPNI